MERATKDGALVTMKWHFVYSDIGTGYFPSVHHGIAHLVAMLKSQGIDVSLHHVTKLPKKKDMQALVDREFPDAVGFTAMSNQLCFVKEWSGWIKEKHNIPVICGGVHATLNPRELLALDTVDAVCIGEGERAILKGFKGMWHKGNGNIWRNEPIPLVENLDELPFPDYSLFDCSSMLKARNGAFPVIASRGCPYHCYYCSNDALRRAQDGLGQYFRCRSVNNTLEMLIVLAGRHPIKAFSFADDIFGLNKEWVYEFCEKYPKAIGLPFDCNLRVESATGELLAALRSAGCFKVEMGIESGNESIRRQVLNRKMSNKQIIDAFDNAHRLGLKTRAYNMIGLPYETPEMARETLELNKKVKPDDVAVFYFCPYKGTKLYDVCEKEGLLTDKQSRSYVSESVLKLPTFSTKELKKAHDEFYRYIVERKAQSYGAVGLLFRMGTGLLRVLTWGNEVKLIEAVYMRLFPLFQRLRSK